MDFSDSSPESQTHHHIIVPSETLREKIRAYSSELREKQRADSYDALRFGLGEIRMEVKDLKNLSVYDVVNLTARMKRSKRATIDEDMYRLSHAFLQSEHNIRAFSKITGSVQLLVTELTGTVAERQLCACETLCNLSLGDAHICEKIASTAGSYLVTYLDSGEAQLKRTVLWTLANVLATGGKGAHTLLQMALVPKLWTLYIGQHGQRNKLELDIDLDSDFRQDAGVCLQLITLPELKLLRTEDRVFIRDHITAKQSSCSESGQYHLQIVFNSEVVGAQTTLAKNEMLYLIDYALHNLSGVSDLNNVANRLRVVFAVRLLSNLVDSQPDALDVLLLQLDNVWSTDLTTMLNKVFSFQQAELTIETLALLHNILEREGNRCCALMPHNLLGALKIKR